jgi:hypothetical protein
MDFSQPMRHGDFITAVMRVRTAEDAVRFYQEYLDHLLHDEDVPSPEEAARIAQANIGYILGEGMTDEQIRMWVESTPVRHPMLGTMDPRPTFADLIEAGYRYAQERSERRRRLDLLREGIATDDT